MADKIYQVLFLCTGNSARSILAEAILNREGKGNFQAWSAGSNPTGKVNPGSIELLKSLGYPVEGLRSKNWDEFSGEDAPALDFVFTVCDNAAGETCPVWPGQPMSAHWGVPDPAAVTGSEEEIRAAFARAYQMLSHRLSLFLALPLESIDKMSLQNRLKEIGQTADAECNS